MRSRPFLFATTGIKTDVLIAAWIVLWLVAGVLVAREVRQIGQLGDTLDQNAQAIEQVSNALELVAEVPFVGDAVAEIAANLDATAVDIRGSAVTARDTTNDLSWLLGFCIAVIPSVPFLVLYVPQRIVDSRERQALKAALRGPRRLEAERYLALRALTQERFHELVAGESQVLSEMDDRHVSALASREKERMGVDA